MTLPNFLVVGAAKSGTTSLHYYLSEHPDIFMPECKETHFFSEEVESCNTNRKGGLYGRGRVAHRAEYEALFGQASDAQAVGEACVSYMYFHQTTIPKIKALLSDPKIIIILRNPIERGFSNYLHHRRDGFESLPFLDAVRRAPERKKKHWWWGYQYVEVGLYTEAVRAYRDAFSAVKVVFFEQLKTDPEALMRELYEFLGVSTSFVPNVDKKYNQAGIPRYPWVARARKNSTLAWRLLSRCNRYRLGQSVTRALTRHADKCPSLEPRERRAMAPYFAEDIRALEALLAIDLTAWR